MDKGVTVVVLSSKDYFKKMDNIGNEKYNSTLNPKN